LNKWRLLIIMVVLTSLVLIVGASIFNWNPWDSLTAGAHLRTGRPFPIPHNNAPFLIKILASFFATFLFSVIVLYLFPRNIFRMSIEFSLTTEILRQALLGLLFFILIGIGTISAVLSIFTVPLAVCLVALIFLSSFVGVMAFSLNLGRWLLEQAGWIENPPPLYLGLGLLILFALFNLPFVGILVLIVIACIGLGTTISTRFGADQPWNFNSFVEEEKK
jgi:uncharacterized membrane protein